MIHLIGEYHYDINIGSKYFATLESLKPDVITIENIPDSDNLAGQLAKLRRAHSAHDPFSSYTLRLEELSRQNPHTTKEIIDRCFLNAIAPELIIRQYVQQHPNTQVKYIEVPDIDVLEGIKEIYQEIIEKSQDGSIFPSSIDEWYDVTEVMYKEPCMVDELHVSEHEYRDEYAAAKIKKLKGTIVHFGGLDHMFGDYHNLYERLKPLGAKRYKLNEFEK
jgi:hypothetical protein